MYSSLSLFFLFLHLIFPQGKAQTSSYQIGTGSQNQDAVSSFQPSLAVVIGILAIMFSLTFILLVYAKFCRNNSNNHPSSLQNHVFDGLPRSRSRLSGIDKTVIESLPFFRFSSLKGTRGGLECAICLSKFEDIELLRLLPKCKHAFHMNCLDQWLEKHSSCPLCRDKLSADDLAAFNYSTSLRFLWNQSELRQESNLELYVQREQSHHGSSRFSVAGSFRKMDKEKKEDELLIHPKEDNNEDEDDQLHKFNHRIIVNDSVLMKNRWSNVSSSDLMFLNSELLNEASSTRFSALQSGFHDNNQPMNPTRLIGGGEIMNIKEEMERKREFESKIQQNEAFPPLPNFQKASDIKRDAKDSRICPSEKRSMSEIVVFPRTYRDHVVRVEENSGNEEKMRRIWLPIVRRTVEWFANRERSTNQNQNITITEP